jgi:hypothetical protein
MADTVKNTLRIPLGAKTGPEGRPLYGWHECPADCLSGLAVHKALKGGRWKWMVTHESSGLALGVLGAMTRARALENMRAAVALGFDWTLPEAEALTAMRQSRGLVDALRRIGESN